MRLPLAGLALATVLLLAATAGPLDLLGRALIAAGQPGAASTVFLDPDWKGLALYRAGRFAEASDSFAAGRDRSAAYNAGNALARLGAYAAAIDAYDRALARDPEDADARANRALVLALIGPGAGAPGGAAGGAGESRSGAANPDRAVAPDAPVPSGGDGLAGTREAASSLGEGGRAPGRAPQRNSAVSEAGRLGGGSGGEATRGGSRNEAPDPSAARGAAAFAGRERVQATEQWLATVPDDPKRSLRIRIAAEARRRALAGLSAEPGADPW